MKEPPDSISDQLAITVAETGSLHLPGELLEFSIDQALEDGLLKDVPFVGWIAKGIALKKTISDRILFHKILRFLNALESFDSGSKSSFRKKVSDDPAFRRKVGEHLLLILDRVDDFDKAELIAKCFDDFLTGDIDQSHFIDLSHIVDRSALKDLRSLTTPPNERMIFRTNGAAASGICDFHLFEPDDEAELPVVGWTLSEYGRDLRDIILDEFRLRVGIECQERQKRKETEAMRVENKMRDKGLDTSSAEHRRRVRDFLRD